mmetsp:Transcript_153044/g.264943  ORF Transcript_153044/g.264943 Transcript_153044/m.264943 type:complete len:294 (-) Transcript_153044:71-952(-)
MEIKMQQLPQVLQRLEEDWVALAGKHKASQCFVEVHAQLEVHLHPFFMGDRLAWGLRKAAGELLLKFNQALGCMPLTIADLTPAGSRHGAIVAESPYVHFLASFHTVGFAPKKGQHLVGRITDIQHQGRLNLQVLGSIHSYAMKQSLPKKLYFERGEPGTWCMEEHGALTEQHLVRFEVAQVKPTSGSMSLVVSLGESLHIIAKGPRCKQASSSSSATLPAAEAHEMSNTPKGKEKKRKKEHATDSHGKADAVPEEPVNGLEAETPKSENASKAETPSKKGSKRKKLQSSPAQ